MKQSCLDASVDLAQVYAKFVLQVQESYRESVTVVSNGMGSVSEWPARKLFNILFVCQ